MHHVNSCRWIQMNGPDAPTREADPNPTASTNQRVSCGSLHTVANPSAWSQPSTHNDRRPGSVRGFEGFWEGFWGVLRGFDWLGLSITNSKKIKKNIKLAHIVLLCRIVTRKKNINMIYIHFYEKSFTKLSFLEQCSMEFKGESSAHPRVGGGFENEKCFKLHFGLTKKDLNLLFSFSCFKLVLYISFY